MPDANDIALLREYADCNFESAFSKIVHRHINLVYSVALRFTGNGQDAQDVTQAVFVILARKASSISHKIVLTGWLYETTRYTAMNFLTSNARRQAREQEAYMQSILDSNTESIWRQLAPMLEEAMSRLSEKERTLVALRFFENRSVAETASALGIQEWAARKRVERAMEKLQKFFLKRGIASTTAILTAAISANSVQAAPVALAKSVTAVAIAKGVAASTSTLTLIKGALKIMAWTKAKTAIVSIVIVGIATFSVIQHQAQVKLREQNEALQQQMTKLQIENARLSIKPAQTPHLPAPQMQMPTAAAALPKEDLQTTNLFGRFKDNAPKLTAEQIDAYLKANGRKASSLLAAYRTSGDPALLKEAMEKYPNDPQVAFEAALDKDLSPDEQRQWLNTFEKSAPNNALANYLSALNYFNSGQIDQGVQELTAASGKPLDDYTLNRMQDDEEAYTSAGYSAAEAERIADAWLVLPQDVQEKQLGLDLVALANAYPEEQAAGIG